MNYSSIKREGGLDFDQLQHKEDENSSLESAAEVLRCINVMTTIFVLLPSLIILFHIFTFKQSPNLSLPKWDMQIKC